MGEIWGGSNIADTRCWVTVKKRTERALQILTPGTMGPTVLLDIATLSQDLLASHMPDTLPRLWHYQRSKALSQIYLTSLGKHTALLCCFFQLH